MRLMNRICGKYSTALHTFGKPKSGAVWINWCVVISSRRYGCEGDKRKFKGSGTLRNGVIEGRGLN